VTSLYPLRLTPSPRERIWGTTDLRPYFGEFAKPVGEIWYSFEANQVTNGSLAGRTLASLMSEFGQDLMGSAHDPRNLVRRSAGAAARDDSAPRGPYFPILTKMLFAAKTLSVQVHPADEYALELEGGPGKTELWYVTTALPGASVALGLTEQMSATQLSQAARSGEIERFLNWIPVAAGDALLIPPGTLHTLGEGVTICEIQQNSDLTYRFFDFGRLDASGNPRELHVDQGAAVVRSDAPRDKLTLQAIPDPLFERSLVASCPYFETEKLAWTSSVQYQTNGERFELLMFVEGSGRIGPDSYRPGDCYLIPASADSFGIQADSPSVALRTFEPAA
jgi:mannose-6-phosphate isomerase